MYGSSSRVNLNAYDYYVRYTETKPDPEMEKLLKADAGMEQKARELVAQYRKAKDAQPRTDLKAKLVDLTKNHFQIRQERRDLEISRLEAQLERVRAAVKKRNELKDMIINRRVAKLLGEEDDLAF